MRQRLPGELPLGSYQTCEQDKDQKKAWTYEPQGIDVLLEIGCYFVAPFKKDLLVHSVSVETGADYREGVVRDEEKNPDNQSWPQAAEEKVGQSDAPDTALADRLEDVLYELVRQ